jgi:hypothetical protein
MTANTIKAFQRFGLKATVRTIFCCQITPGKGN